MANFSPPDLYSFEHRFGYKLGIKLKSQHTTKAQSLEAMLPAIVLICDVFRVPLSKQDTIRKGRIYENATRYTRTLLYTRMLQELNL